MGALFSYVDLEARLGRIIRRGRVNDALAKLAGAERASISQLSISQLSISQLTAGSGMTRQAITKHLRVLEKTSIVRCTRQGRESLYALDLEPLVELRAYLEQMSRAWDDRLSRLKALVESDG